MEGSDVGLEDMAPVPVAGFVLLPAAYDTLETGMTGRVITVTAGDEADTVPAAAEEDLMGEDKAFETGQTVV